LGAGKDDVPRVDAGVDHGLVEHELAVTCQGQLARRQQSLVDVAPGALEEVLHLGVVEPGRHQTISERMTSSASMARPASLTSSSEMRLDTIAPRSRRPVSTRPM